MKKFMIAMISALILISCASMRGDVPNPTMDETTDVMINVMEGILSSPW